MNKIIIVSYPKSEAYYIDTKIVKFDIHFLKKYEKENKIFLKIYEEEFHNLYKYDYKHVLVFEKSTSIKGLTDIFLNNTNLFITSIIIMALLFLSNMIILDVNVHTSDVRIKRLVTYKLIDFNVHSFSFKKSSRKINMIKDYIKNKYSSDIEWIEITPHGYTYDIDVIKKQIKKPLSTNDKCNYVARKSGNIKSIKVRKGVLLVQENNYVKAGDVLISGSVIYNDELKSELCASGYITGEVWYKVDLSYPLYENKMVPSKEKQYNFRINLLNKSIKIFNDKYKQDMNIKKIGNSIFGITFYKTYNLRKKTKKLSTKKALEKALKNARKNVLVKLPKSSKIISQNVLKKYIKNDKIYIEVLVTTEEEIGVVENYY